MRKDNMFRALHARLVLLLVDESGMSTVELRGDLELHPCCVVTASTRRYHGSFCHVKNARNLAGVRSS